MTGVGCFFWSSFAQGHGCRVESFLVRWWLRGLVGLLFEICIVDASIFTIGGSSACLVGVLVVCMCKCWLVLPCLEGAGWRGWPAFDWGGSVVFFS